jgi:hypothetical protein
MTPAGDGGAFFKGQVKNENTNLRRAHDYKKTHHPLVFFYFWNMPVFHCMGSMHPLDRGRICL